MNLSAPTTTLPRCLHCSRDDFAGGRRCQWCGTYFGQPLLVDDPLAPAAVAGAGPDALNPALPPTGTAEGEDEKAPPHSWWKKLLVPFSWLLVLLGKFKGLLVLAKSGKLLSTLVSMLVSIGFYAMVFGWKFAVGLVGLLFVHELGHLLWIKHKGLESRGMLFIPFIGAAVFLKQRPQDPLTDAEISYAGPFLGTLGAAACYPVYLSTGSPLWLAIAHMGFFLNLFNLAPAPPLDGGWIVRALYPKFWFAGTLIAVAVGLATHSTFLVIIGGLSALRAWSSLRGGDDDEEEAREQIAPSARTRMTVLYLGLALMLGLALAHTTQELQLLRETGVIGGGR